MGGEYQACGGEALKRDAASIPPPPLQTLKLFMPLTAVYYEPEDGENVPEKREPLDGRELLAYEDRIRASMHKERTPEESDRGMMLYYHTEDGAADDGVSRKVKSYVFTAEARDGQLWGVAECQVQGKLTPEELDKLMETVEEQAIYGFGGIYEQHPIRMGDGGLFVHLWNADSWSIMTEQDRFDPRFSERLPEVCLSVHPDTGALIRITRGVGYRVVGNSGEAAGFNRCWAACRNEERGISPAQAEAMLCGCLHGWDCPAADPHTYAQKPFQMGGIQ